MPMDHRRSRTARSRAAAAIGTAAAAALLLPLAAPSSAVQPARTPHAAGSVVVVKDRHADVEKNWAPIRKRKGPLDIYWARARVTDDVVSITVRVADLRPAHTRDVGTDGMHVLASLLAVAVKWGRHVEYVLYSTDDDSPSGNGLLDYSNCPEPEPVSAYDMSGLDQDADYDKNTYTFTIPVSCLPASQDSLRVSAYTGWVGGPMSVPTFSDHITRPGSNQFKWSPSLAYR